MSTYNYEYKYLSEEELILPVRMALGNSKLEYSQVLALQDKLHAVAQTLSERRTEV